MPKKDGSTTPDLIDILAVCDDSIVKLYDLMNKVAALHHRGISPKACLSLLETTIERFEELRGVIRSNTTEHLSPSERANYLSCLAKDCEDLAALTSDMYNEISQLIANFNTQLIANFNVGLYSSTVRCTTGSDGPKRDDMQPSGVRGCIGIVSASGDPLVDSMGGNGPGCKMDAFW